MSASGDRPLTEVTGPIVISGMLSVLVLLAMGVLSTAGEWTNGSVQTTYLLEPRRTRVLAAKSVAVAAIGAGVGAALGNTAAAPTGVYLVNLGVLPLLETFKPALAHKIDPGNAVLSLAQGGKTALSITILAGWVAVALVAGAVMTRRRPLQ